MLTVATWLVDLMVSVLAVSGYITYYNQLLTNPRLAHRRTGLILLVALALEVARVIDPVNFKVYENIQLFVLVFPLLDAKIGAGDLGLRIAALLTLGAYNHTGAPWWGQWLGMAITLGAVVVMRRAPSVCRYNFAANTGLALWIATNYWLPRADADPATTVGLVLTFVLFNFINFNYWSALNRRDLAQAALQRRVAIDPLTDAKSYAVFRTDALTAFTQAKATRRPLTIVMLDIDRFKRINDHYGHPVGDAVLVECLSRLERTLADRFAGVYRTGGEEFTLLLPDHGPSDALPLVTACRDAIRSQPIDCDGVAINVTLSMGMRGMTADTPDFDTLYRQVDDDLYLSKAHGRDTLTVNGQTLWYTGRPTVSHFFAQVSQSVVAVADQSLYSIELMPRFYDEAAHRWRVPETFVTYLDAELAFLADATKVAGVSRISLYITPVEFEAPGTLRQMNWFRKQYPHITDIVLVLYEAPEEATLRRLMPMYNAANVEVCLQVRHAQLDRPELPARLPLVNYVSVNLRPASDTGFTRLTQRVLAAGGTLCIRGVRTQADFDRVRAIGAQHANGPYFGEPVLPQIASRQNRAAASEQPAAPATNLL